MAEIDVSDYETEDVELIVEPEGEGADEQKADAAAKLEEYQKIASELESLKSQQSGSKEVLEGIKLLAERLESLRSTPTETKPVQSQAPEEDYEAFRKRLEEISVTDPIKGMEEYMKRFLQKEIVPAFQHLAGQVSATTLATSRAMAQQDPTNKLVMEKWGRDVEQRVKELPPGPDVYERACKAVAAEHLADLIQIRMQEMEAEKQKSAVPPAKGAVPATAGTPQGPAKRVVKLTPQEYELCRRKGIDPVMYAEVFKKGGKG